jgi:hypothetical protein
MITDCKSMHVFPGCHDNSNELVSDTECFNSSGVVGFADFVSVVDVQITSANTAMTHLQNDGVLKIK